MMMMMKKKFSCFKMWQNSKKKWKYYHSVCVCVQTFFFHNGKYNSFVIIMLCWCFSLFLLFVFFICQFGFQFQNKNYSVVFHSGILDINNGNNNNNNDNKKHDGIISPFVVWEWILIFFCSNFIFHWCQNIVVVVVVCPESLEMKPKSIWIECKITEQTKRKNWKINIHHRSGIECECEY